MISEELVKIQDILRTASADIHSIQCSSVVSVPTAGALTPVGDYVVRAINELDTAVGAALRNERKR